MKHNIDFKHSEPEERVRKLVEELKLEEIISEIKGPLPEDAAKSPQFQRYVNETLAELPKAWRRAFVLHMIEGLSLKEVAEVTSMTEIEVKHYVEYAIEFLRQKIAESGVKVSRSRESELKTKARRTAL